MYVRLGHVSLQTLLYIAVGVAGLLGVRVPNNQLPGLFFPPCVCRRVSSARVTHIEVSHDK